VDRSSDILYQTSLVEREIEQLLSNRKRKRVIQTEKITPMKEGNVEKVDEVAARPIEEDEVCPICQDVLIEETPKQTIHCFTSCGNNMHMKCIRILMNHQKTLGKDCINCPVLPL
jgi:hypothetical protein